MMKRRGARSKFTVADDVGLLRAIIRVGAHLAPSGMRGRLMRRAFPLIQKYRPRVASQPRFRHTESSLENRYYYLISKRSKDSSLTQVVESTEIMNLRNDLLQKIVQDLESCPPRIVSNMTSDTDDRPSSTYTSPEYHDAPDLLPHPSYVEEAISPGYEEFIDPEECCSAEPPSKYQSAVAPVDEEPSRYVQPRENASPNPELSDVRNITQPDDEGATNGHFAQSFPDKFETSGNNDPYVHGSRHCTKPVQRVARRQQLEWEIFNSEQEDRFQRFQAMYRREWAKLREKEARLEECKRNYFASRKERKRRFKIQKRMELLLEEKRVLMAKKEPKLDLQSPVLEDIYQETGVPRSASTGKHAPFDPEW